MARNRRISICSEEPIDLINAAADVNPKEAAPEPPDNESTMQEMMALLRQQNSILSSPEKFFAPIVEMLANRTRVDSESSISPVKARYLKNSLNLDQGVGKSMKLSNLARLYVEPDKKQEE